MKFYNMAISYNGDDGMVESVAVNVGKWATRADAEQAAKDAVEMAKLAQQVIYELYDGKAAHVGDSRYVNTQAIIERYKGINNLTKEVL